MPENMDMPLVGREKVNQYNRQLILSLFKGGKTLARRDIVALTGMRQGTMQVHVESLLKEKILVETGPGSSKAGRRPTLLEINPRRYFIVGGYLQPENVHLVLSDLLGHILSHHTEHPTVEEDRSHLLLALGRGLIHLIEDKCRRQDILGIALGAVGRVDVKEQTLTETHFGRWWKGIELGRYIRGQFGCTSWVENDIHLATLAEARFGVSRDVNHFLFVSIENQLQVGVMVDGRVYSGFKGVAGKLGHVCVDPGGPLCGCGNRGCLKMLASNDALIDFYRKLVGKDKLKVSVEEIVTYARDGQTAAKYALEQVAKWLGLGLANLANIFNPEKIVLSGQISLAGELFLETLTGVITERTTPPTNQLRVEWSQLADQGIPMGAIALALDEFFALPVLESPILLAEE
ncbi:MAG: ROK family protein [Phycisphaerae bacterium]